MSGKRVAVRKPRPVQLRRKARVEFYEDNINEWRWRLIAPNCRVVADSGEGDTSKSWCMKAFARVPGWCMRATHVVLEPRD